MYVHKWLDKVLIYIYHNSGHLARHHRIHTGEKNFHCIYPGCPSKFSRQDNMMQHYRTHLSSRSRHHQYLNHYPQHCQHIYYNSDTSTELYSLRQEGVIHNNNRGWSFSSSSSSSSTSSSNQYFTPNFHTSTPQYRQPLSQSQSQSQNWNNNSSSNNAYSSPPSFYNYNDPV